MGVLSDIQAERPVSTDARIGTATVADLRTLPGAEALAVLLLRDWSGGAEGQARMADLMLTTLGPAAGGTALDGLDALFRMLTTEGRRPLQCRSLSNRAVGADEAVVANLLAVAATGMPEDAMLIASLLLPADRLLVAAHLAAEAGRAIARADLRNTAHFQSIQTRH